MPYLTQLDSATVLSILILEIEFGIRVRREGRNISFLKRLLHWRKLNVPKKYVAFRASVVHLICF